MALDTPRGANNMEIGRPFSLFNRSVIRRNMDTLTFVDTGDVLTLEVKDIPGKTVNIANVVGEINYKGNRLLNYIVEIRDAATPDKVEYMDLYMDHDGDCFEKDIRPPHYMMHLDGGKLKAADNQAGPPAGEEKERYDSMVDQASKEFDRVQTERTRGINAHDRARRNIPGTVERVTHGTANSVKRLFRKIGIH